MSLRPPLRRLAAAVAALATAAGIATPAAAAARPAAPTIGILPPSNPSGNYVPPRSMRSPLKWVDAARAGEGVGRLVLPSNYGRLPAAERLFVLIDLERVNRGERPIVGLSPALSAASAAGAALHVDPTGPGNGQWWSVWAEAQDGLAADYFWLYDDGWGGTNVGCTSPASGACWIHRDILLHLGGGLVAGIATHGDGYAGLLAAGYPTSGLSFTWAGELRYFKHRPGLERRR